MEGDSWLGRRLQHHTLWPLVIPLSSYSLFTDQDFSPQHWAVPGCKSQKNVGDKAAYRLESAYAACQRQRAYL